MPGRRFVPIQGHKHPGANGGWWGGGAIWHKRRYRAIKRWAPQRVHLSIDLSTLGSTSLSPSNRPHYDPSPPRSRSPPSPPFSLSAKGFGSPRASGRTPTPSTWPTRLRLVSSLITTQGIVDSLFVLPCAPPGSSVSQPHLFGFPQPNEYSNLDLSIFIRLIFLPHL